MSRDRSETVLVRTLVVQAAQALYQRTRKPVSSSDILRELHRTRPDVVAQWGDDSGEVRVAQAIKSALQPTAGGLVVRVGQRREAGGVVRQLYVPTEAVQATIGAHRKMIESIDACVPIVREDVRAGLLSARAYITAALAVRAREVITGVVGTVMTEALAASRASDGAGADG